MLTKDHAICIRTVDFSETSQIVTFFTKATGKIGAIAKGSKRPKSSFDGPIEMLSHGRIVFTDTNREKLATLTEFQSAAAPPGPRLLRNNLFTLNCGLFAAELINRLTHEYDPHPELFESFLQFLKNARDAENESQMLAMLILFQLALLKEVGLQPILNACANCKEQHAIRNAQYQLYFSSSANGLICRDCEQVFQDKIRLNPKAAACLANLRLLTESTKKTLNEIEKTLIHHFTELTGRQPKMAKHILKN